MDVDTLFTVIFVVVIILFQAFGVVAGRLVKKGRAVPDKSAKPGGLIGVLASRVNREIQAARQQAAAARTGPAGQNGSLDALLQTGQAGRDIFAELNARLPVGEKPMPRVEKTEGWSDAKRAARLRAVAQEATLPAADDAAVAEQAVIEEIRKGRLDNAAGKNAATEPVAPEDGYAAADLRRAVVWAEILAPPVALRE